MEHPLLSSTAVSVLFNKGIASKFDKRQLVKPNYEIPDEETRKLLAELILEEAKETISALGFDLACTDEFNHPMMVTGLHLVPNEMQAGHSTLMDIVDGCCDTIYVCTGALIACGVPDVPHMEEVCRANDAKFPGGIATINKETGKYLKPEGWVGPSHIAVKDFIVKGFDMKKMQELIVEQKSK